MKVALINPPRSRHSVDELAPPLGLLRLAQSAVLHGNSPVIFDFNLNWHVDVNLQTDFYGVAVSQLLETDADVFAFTSMAVDSHVALELARRVKIVLPKAKIVLGGAHFSSIANAVLELYPWVDFVVRGEGEASFIEVLQRLRLGQFSQSRIVSAAKSDPSGRIKSNSFSELSSIELFSDCSTYFKINPRRVLNAETSRGCRFKCSFCYSPVHYPTISNFSIELVVSEISLMKQIGAEHLFLVDDNLLNDSLRAVRLCDALADADLGITWECYATLPQLQGDIVERMAAAGCTSVFTGVDAVGQFSQYFFKKRFYRNQDSLEYRVKELLEFGIKPTFAFLLAPPSHPSGPNFEETVLAALAARCCGADVRLNSLTLYPQTGVSGFHCGEVVFDPRKPRLMMDVPLEVEENAYAVQRPELFPFHNRYVSNDEWGTFLHLTHTLLTLINTYPQTLDLLWNKNHVSPTEIAKKTIELTGELEGIPTAERRPEEQVAALSVLQKYAKDHVLINSLENENPLISDYAIH